MKTKRIVIDGREYLLAPRENTTRLMRGAARAARRGGGSIAFTSPGAGKISVLVTNKTVLRVESVKTSLLKKVLSEEDESGPVDGADLLHFLEHHL